MMLLRLSLILLLCLCGCVSQGSLTAKPEPAEPLVPSAAQQFSSAFDRFAAGKGLVALRELARQGEVSDWQQRAQLIILYVDELRLRKQQLAETRREQQLLLAEKQLLSETIEQLKVLLIEQELRGQ